MGAAISMTSITTFLGFLSLCGHSIPILREFGISASFGIRSGKESTQSKESKQGGRRNGSKRRR